MNIAAFAGFSYRYRGFMRAGMNYGFHTSLHERMNVIFMLRYWVEFVGRMEPDAARFYTFDTSPADSPFSARGERAAAVWARHVAATARRSGELSLTGFARATQFDRACPILRAADSQISSAERIQPRGLANIPKTDRDIRPQGSALSLVAQLRLHDDRRLSGWCASGICVSPAFMDKFYGEGKRATESRFEYFRFDERSAEFGINRHNAGRGVAVEDYDRDGYLDIVTGGSFDDLRCYHNQGGKTFEDWTARAGLADRRQPFFISVADIDNDGWPDLLVTHMYRDGFELYHNNGNGMFADVTKGSGLMDRRPVNAISSGWAPSWADVDNDGDLDLFVPQMGMDIPFAGGLLARPGMRSALYINDHGHFSDRTAEYGLADVVYDRYFTGSAFGDVVGVASPTCSYRARSSTIASC